MKDDLETEQKSAHSRFIGKTFYKKPKYIMQGEEKCQMQWID